MLLLVRCPGPRQYAEFMESDAIAGRQTQGKQAAGTPLKKRVPRTPLGPSVKRIDLTFRRCTGAVCQKSIPVDGYKLLPATGARGQ
jgi:hypothetical protein